MCRVIVIVGISIIKMSTENNNLRTLSKAYKHHIGVVQFGANETYDHFLAKAKICYHLKKNKKAFCTEAIFENGKRCDVFNLTDSICIEVMKSEKIESIENKRSEYPCFINYVYAEDIIACKFDKLYKLID